MDSFGLGELKGNKNLWFITAGTWWRIRQRSGIRSGSVLKGTGQHGRWPDWSSRSTCFNSYITTFKCSFSWSTLNEDEYFDVSMLMIQPRFIQVHTCLLWGLISGFFIISEALSFLILSFPSFFSSLPLSSLVIPSFLHFFLHFLLPSPFILLLDPLLSSSPSFLHVFFLIFSFLFLPSFFLNLFHTTCLYVPSFLQKFSSRAVDYSSPFNPCFHRDGPSQIIHFY